VQSVVISMNDSAKIPEHGRFNPGWHNCQAVFP
jgi:hypothetical protein